GAGGSADGVATPLGRKRAAARLLRCAALWGAVLCITAYTAEACGCLSRSRARGLRHRCAPRALSCTPLTTTLIDVRRKSLWTAAHLHTVRRLCQGVHWHDRRGC